MKTNKFFSLLILFGCALLAGCNPDDPKAPNSNPSQVIRYTTSDGAPIALANVWKETGGGIIYHSYENGIGIIVFESPITEIVNRGFSNCRNLISITIPDSVTSIGESAFYNCTGLTSVTIPDSVTSIGGSAFYNCSSLTSVYCKSTTPPKIGSSVFKVNAPGRKIYVPKASVFSYQLTECWSDYADAIVGYNF